MNQNNGLKALDYYGALTLIRGLPGAGKTSFVNQILANNMAIQPQCSVSIATDDYFYNSNGEYKFNRKLLGMNHQACQDQVEVYMKDSVTFEIFIHNTFTVYEKEMEPYYALAKKYNWAVFSIIIENRHNGKSIHGVEQDTLDNMKERFQVVL